jgi:very-short-patch-repair endonuclease
MTPTEKALWKLLRQVEGAHFRKQPPVGKYAFDFGCYSARLLIELDGGVHDWSDVQERDKAKSLHAALNGFHLLRFTNADVQKRPAWVLEQVHAALDASNAGASDRPPPPAPPHKGAGSE